MNKKGIAPLVLLTIAGIIAGMIVLAIFFVSSYFRWVLIGIGLFIAAVYILASVNDSRVKLTAFLILVGIGIFFVFWGSTQQSVLSADEIYVGSDGKVYWTFYASANNPGENYIFTSRPRTYTKSDGTEVDPQDDLVLTISPGEPICTYQLQKSTYSNVYPYYTLKNPERKIDVEIYDRNNLMALLDGTLVDSASIQDTDRKGSVVVETQGLLGGKFNCPDNDNVAVLFDIEQGTYAIAYKDEINNWIDTHSSVWCWIGGLFGFCGGTVTPQENIAFMSAFEDGSLKVTDTELSGEIPFGYPTFTITADQDYFNSIIYSPPELADPKIVDVDYPQEVTTDDTSSIKVALKNRNDNEASAIITADVETGSISPTAKNIVVSGTESYVTFSFKAPLSEQLNNKISFEVCSISQFSTQENCDSEAIYIDIISDTPIEYCGDDICQDFESYTTCPQDCTQSITCGDGICQATESYETCPEDCKQIECEWWEEPYTKEEKDYGFLYWRALFNNPITYTVQGCRTAGWVYVGVGAIIILILGIMVIMIWRPRGPPRRSRRRR